jgi:hypothetical protein
LKISQAGKHITLDFRSARVVRDSAFSELSSKLSGQPGVTDPDALAAGIGRKKLGAAAFNKKALEGRTGDDDLGVPDHGFLGEKEHPMNCMLCGGIKSSHTTKDDWSPEAREAAAAARRNGTSGRTEAGRYEGPNTGLERRMLKELQDEHGDKYSDKVFMASVRSGREPWSL